MGLGTARAARNPRIIIQNGGPISWFSVLGKTVALSTCEAEINAAVKAAKDAIDIGRIMFDLGLKDEDGVLISMVNPNEPAEKGGLKSGDVILEFNGKKIKSCSFKRFLKE